MTTLALLELSMGHLLVILVILLLLFGGRLPDVGRNLGRGIAQFKKGLAEAEHEVDSAVKSASTETPPQPKKPEDQPKA